MGGLTIALQHHSNMRCSQHRHNSFLYMLGVREGCFNTTKNKYDNVYVLIHSMCQRTIRKAVFERGECLDMLACFTLAWISVRNNLYCS